MSAFPAPAGSTLPTGRDQQPPLPNVPFSGNLKSILNYYSGWLPAIPPLENGYVGLEFLGILAEHPVVLFFHYFFFYKIFKIRFWSGPNLMSLKGGGVTKKNCAMPLEKIPCPGNFLGNFPPLEQNSGKLAVTL